MGNSVELDVEDIADVIAAAVCSRAVPHMTFQEHLDKLKKRGYRPPGVEWETIARMILVEMTQFWESQGWPHRSESPKDRN